MNNEPKLISLFPYQIKDVNLFYHRNHPKNLHPHSAKFIQYWTDFRNKCIEGLWVNDNGTWVYMMPKLFFYINYVKVTINKTRDFLPPRLRDNEWIFFSYIMCYDGFSGFVGDKEFTCHDYIRRIEECADPRREDSDKEPLDDIELSLIPESCKKEDGTYKKYVDPWHYLTRHYLVENKTDKPLGEALYENSIQNGFALTGRGMAKSYNFIVGDFLHEFLFNGIKKASDIKKVNDKLLFGLGASDGEYLKKSLKNVSVFYDKMPGQYTFSDSTKPKYMGPFYKKLQGTWKIAEETTHIVKYKNGSSFIESSTVYPSILTVDRSKVGAGDRFRRIYLEEVGFMGNLLEVHSANRDSLKSEGYKVGSAVYLGTGGDLQNIKGPKMIFDNPKTYDIFGIPNYWENPNKKIGLFIPSHYVEGKYKDKNGNTNLKLAHENLLKQRKKNAITMDSVSYDSDISFNPMEPREILRSNSGSILPKKEAQDQLSKLDIFDIFKKRAQIGEFKFDPLEPRGVGWYKDMSNVLRPILDFGMDATPGFNKDGAWIIYEQPPTYIPDGLYWIIYDPAKKSGDGESYHSILVYKSFFIGNEKTLYDTIVAEIICRKETLNDNYIEVIKAAKYFNAKIFPEISVAGFVEWCKSNKYWGLLEEDAYLIEKEINPDGKRSYYRVGFDMSNARKKNWCFRRLRDWLLETKENDPITGVPSIKTMDWIFSKRILNEITQYEDDGNFDHISSLLGLMILIGKLHGSDVAKIPTEDEIEDEDIKYLKSLEQQYAETGSKYTGSKFLKY